MKKILLKHFVGNVDVIIFKLVTYRALDITKMILYSEHALSRTHKHINDLSHVSREMNL
jgi:hypothetical protein